MIILKVTGIKRNSSNNEDVTRKHDADSLFLSDSGVRPAAVPAAASPQGVQVQPLSDPRGRGRHRRGVSPLQGVRERGVPQRQLPAQSLPGGERAS